MQKLRDNPVCAQQEFDRLLDAADPGLHVKLTYDPNENPTPVRAVLDPQSSILNPLLVQDRHPCASRA